MASRSPVRSIRGVVASTSGASGAASEHPAASRGTAPPAAEMAIPVYTATATRSTKFERILAVKVEALPDTFRRNSTKEQLVLDYVEAFRKQFVQLYPDRAPLLLMPKNEAGIPKFVCTTLRPTLMPYKELYDVASCARFFAAYIHYEPLDDPVLVPAYVPSPYYTLQTRVGDSFDMAAVLCSFLLGAGYDAYVVSGSAPRWVTLQREDRSRVDWSPPADAVDRVAHTSETALGIAPRRAAPAEPPGVSRYKLPPPPQLTSEYLKVAGGKMEAESKVKAAANDHESDDETSDQELERLRKETYARTEAGGIARERSATGSAAESARASSRSPSTSRGRSPALLASSRSRSRGPAGGTARGMSTSRLHVPEDEEAGGSDPLHRTRVHAWVLVRAGRREVAEHMFVEPSTGCIYNVRTSPYYAIESVWNHRNYYVNMQSQPVLPRQDLGDKSQLVDALRNTLDGTSGERLQPGGLLSRMRTPGSVASSRSFFDAAARTGTADVAGKFVSPYAAKVDGRGVATAGVPAGAPTLDPRAASSALAKRPPLRGELSHRSETDGAGPVGGSGARAESPERSSSRPRSRPHMAGAMDTWRKELSVTQSALQAQVADILLRQNETRDLASLSYDLGNEDEWEFVMLPPEASGKPGDDGTGYASILGGGHGREDGKDGEGKLDEAGGDASAGADGSTGTAGRVFSGSLLASQPLTTGAFANAQVELDGEHVLDLPQSWVPRLIIERNLAHIHLAATEAHVVQYYKARLEVFAPRRHPTSLIARLTEYHDSSRLRPFRVIEAFGKRRDGLYKRVRHLDVQTVEEHFDKGRAGGLALFVDVLGKRHELYFYAGARVDGLLKRVHDFGVKITEYYGDTPNRLYYRSVSLLEGSAAAEEVLTLDTLAPVMRGAAAASTGKTATGKASASSRLPTVNIGLGQEASVRKMTEKYRRDATETVPAHKDMSKVVYLLEDDAIQVTFHHAAGRVTASTRLYQRSTGAMEALAVDPYAPEPRPFEIDAEFRRLHQQMEKDCHTAARAMAKACIDLLQNRRIEESEVAPERSIFEVALDRVRSGVPVEEQEKEELSKDVDYLMPFLLAVKCKDVNNPSESEARKADKACRVAYKERLLQRVQIISDRLDEENDKLLRKQQAFSRNRDHGEGAEEEFERYCAEATYRIGILEQRLERQETLVTKKYQELEQRLASDARLAIIHNPAALAVRRAAADKEAAARGRAGGAAAANRGAPGGGR